MFDGDMVGVTGNSGRSTGAHLHITCRYKSQMTDPYTLLLYIRQVRGEAFAALLGDVDSFAGAVARSSLPSMPLQPWSNSSVTASLPR